MHSDYCVYKKNFLFIETKLHDILIGQVENDIIVKKVNVDV